MDEDDYLQGISERERTIRRRVHRLAEFYRHAVVFVLVIACLWGLNALQIYLSESSSQWHSWWAMWPTLGWGIGLIAHGVSAAPMWTFFSQDWEDRKVKELMERHRP